MSKFITIFLAVLITAFAFANVCWGQDATVNISIQPGDRSVAVVEGKFDSSGPHREFRFLTQIGHLKGLEQRISSLESTSVNGTEASLHVAAQGRYISENDISAW